MAPYLQEHLKTLTICLALSPTCFHTLLEDLRLINLLLFLMRATVVGHYITVTNISMKTIFFMFQSFGMLQKHQMCAAAALQILKLSFLQHQHAIQSLTPFNFETVGAEEQAHQPISNPTIKSFRHTLSAICAKVMSTDESCIRICSLI